ncbi:MAG: hypothetical protein ABJI60_15815 [Kangiellaceae bacterium]
MNRFNQSAMSNNAAILTPILRKNSDNAVSSHNYWQERNSVLCRRVLSISSEAQQAQPAE